jgi:hypothetical protein
MIFLVLTMAAKENKFSDIPCLSEKSENRSCAR